MNDLQLLEQIGMLTQLNEQARAREEKMGQEIYRLREQIKVLEERFMKDQNQEAQLGLFPPFYY